MSQYCAFTDGCVGPAFGVTLRSCVQVKVSFLSFLVSLSTDCEGEADLHPLPPCPHSSALTSSEWLTLRGPILNFHPVPEPSPGIAETFGAALWAPKQTA